MKLFGIILSILLCFPLILSQKDNKQFRIDLIRQKSGLEQHLNAPDLPQLGVTFEELQRHYEKNNRTNDSVALYRYLDNEFYGQIVIGHPGQTLNVAFDTAWTLSWVLSATCEIYKNIGCLFHNRYDHTKSSEYKKDGRPFLADQGKYNLTGFYSYDNISIAHSNVTSQSFVEMNSVPYFFLFNKIDGVLGLGFQTDKYVPFFYGLVNEKKIRQPIFSVYLNRDKQSNRGGNILLGFKDKKHIHHIKYKNGSVVYDVIKYLRVDPGQYWKFNVDSVTMTNDKKQNTTMCPNGCKAIADTSVNTIVGPYDDITKIHNEMQAYNIFLNRYAVNCDRINKLPKIDFVLGGQKFHLEGPDYVVKMSYRSITVCLSALVPTATPSEDGLWVLGGAFLTKYYSIYNINTRTIGFVRAF